jgi:hypothetical protein
MLLSRKNITEDLIDMMMGWRRSGFNVYCGPRIQPGEEGAIENMARYIICASFSQQRMTYIPEGSKVLQNEDEPIPGILEPVEDPDFRGNESSGESRKKLGKADRENL